jgi:histone arginine demethylase JMJD6
MQATTMSQPQVTARPNEAAPVTTIDRAGGLSRREFIRRYRDPMVPVILTDATKDWPALSQFTFEFFKRELGDRTVVIGNKKHMLGAFIDLLLQSTPQTPAPYPCKLNARADFADLADAVPRFDLANPDRVRSRLLPKRYLDGLYDLEVFIGGPGGEFPYLHYDYLGLFAYINMVVGSKEFTIYSPDQERLLYVNPEIPWISTVENHHQPDLTKYPLLAQTRPVKVVLTAGETLFIPSGWWHTARSLTPSISVAFDQLCSSNWGFFTRDCCRARRGLKRALTRAVLATAGGLLSVKELLLGKH